MNIGDVKDKITEVWAAARVIVRRYGHTKKFAKHVVAFAIKQTEGFTDEKLAEFLGKDPVGRLLGYVKRPNPSTFSKVRKRSDPKMFEELYNWLVQDAMKGKQVRLLVQDSTDVPAYSAKDRRARMGVRTIPKKRQVDEDKVEFFFGYKLHLDADAEREIPLALSIEPANRHDKRLFRGLFERVKGMFVLNHDAKFLADSACDSWDVRQGLRDSGVTPMIAWNGRRFGKSETPKDRDYGKRWAIERIFSRLKEMFGLSNNRFVGIEKATIHVFSCLIAYLIKYVM
jgi:IS5 family transposase